MDEPDIIECLAEAGHAVDSGGEELLKREAILALRRCWRQRQAAKQRGNHSDAFRESGVNHRFFEK